MTTKAPNKYAVPALDKGLDILEFLANQELPRSQTEIAHGLGRSANEIYRVLVGLEARGYLIRDELSGRYRISLKLYNLSRTISPIDQVRQCALPHMEDLAVKIGQSCHLCMLYQSQAMVIVQARSHSPVSIDIAEGSMFSTLATASGRVLLANSTNEVRDMILERDSVFAKMSQAKRKALFSELDDIKEQGFYVAESDFSEGVCNFATLIGQPEGFVVASLAVPSLLQYGNNQFDQQQMQELVITAANSITQQLGC
ncbi:IclR family transcriptional regulator [Saccharobesus litoralis]|uniref:IclR family transcriptional regulator n=1 Tax=Saccharobesus litoralis TaxID=2172099 RepID=A0A2S0VNX2_9ALTE|nr:IclR family transcriptional regulator [Saccharobesus litoralis]AWB65908.1 IclR family transcriptional regulator [Saccharobesus litoralis]